MNIPSMVKPVQTPMVLRESRALSTAPELTSEEMSSILEAGLEPGHGERVLDEPDPPEDDEVHHAEEASEHARRRCR